MNNKEPIYSLYARIVNGQWRVFVAEKSIEEAMMGKGKTYIAIRNSNDYAVPRVMVKK